MGKAHFAAQAMTNLFEVETALFSRHSSKNISSSQMWNIPESALCQTEAEFYRRAGGADVAVILTPTPLHSRQLKELIGRVDSVICEKTVASSYLDGLELIAASAAGKFRVFPVFNYSGYTQVRHLRRLVEERFFGDLISVSAKMPQQTFLTREEDFSPSRVQEWRLHDGPITGVSLDLGSHLLHLIQFVTQKNLRSVTAQGGHFGIQSNVLDMVQALVKLDGNLPAVVEYGKVHLGHENGLSIEIFGTEQSARWVQTSPDRLEISNNNGHQSVLTKTSGVYRNGPESSYDSFKPGHPSGFVEALSNFYSDVAHVILPPGDSSGFGANFLPTLDDAVSNLRYLELIEKSIVTGNWESTGEIATGE